MEKLVFKVADYDAPLDLILHLIARHKLDITDIDISSLLAQYLNTITAWQQVEMDISSEFLEMASRLVYMKTVSLLPKHEEESHKLRQELSGQLIEYQLCQVAAHQLAQRSNFGAVFARLPMSIALDKHYTGTHPASILYLALADATGKSVRRLPPPKEAFAPLIMTPVVSVTSKIFTVLRTLRTDGPIHKDKLFATAHNRSSLVATFLAVLELIKSGKVCLQEDHLGLK